MKRTWMTIFVLSVFGAGCSGCRPGSTSDSGTLEQLRVGVIPVLSGLPSFVAIDDGLFLEEGFNPVFQEYRSSDLVVAAAKNKEIDLIGVAGMTQILESVEKGPETLQLLGVLFSSTCLVVPTSSAVTGVADLRSANIATFPGSVFARYAKEALSKNGADVEGLVFMPMAPGLQIQALQLMEVGAAYTLEPTCAEAVARGVARYLVGQDLFSTAFLDGRAFPGGGVAARRDFLVGGKDRSARLLAVYGKAMQRLRSPKPPTSYLLRHTTLTREFAPTVKYEGAQFGGEIDRDLVLALHTKLIEWGFLGRPLSAKVFEVASAN